MTTKSTTQFAKEKAAQAWCTPSTSKTSMDGELAQQFAVILDRELDRMKNAAEYLWVVLANVGNGTGRAWKDESADWQKAAAKARDDYHNLCSEMDRQTS